MFTDHFGTPIAVGDEIVYPLSNGRNAASLGHFTVEEIVPLVPHRDHPIRVGYDGKQRHILMRADQQPQARPTEYPDAAPDKRFCLKARGSKSAWQGGGPASRLTSITRSENIVRVPS